jgi:nucleolin
LFFSFGFVEFPSGEAAQSAHDAMQGQEVDGRAITIDYATEKGGGGGGKFVPLTCVLYHVFD